MLKWRDYTEDNTLYEVFLPEHDRDGPSAVLHAVRRGHVVAERKVSLTWRPIFGPDAGDVAAMGAELDRLIADLACQAGPQTQGIYVPGPVEIEEPDPYLLAAIQALFLETQAAIAALEIAAEDVRNWLALPAGCTLEDLYPMAITSRRADRMRKVVALQRLLEAHEALRVRRNTILTAMFREDTATVRAELEAVGIRAELLQRLAVGYSGHVNPPFRSMGTQSRMFD